MESTSKGRKPITEAGRQKLKEFGKQFATVRNSKGMTQAELAEKVGQHVVSIGYIETGKRWPHIGTLNKMSKAMGVTLEDLFKGL